MPTTTPTRPHRQTMSFTTALNLRQVAAEDFETQTPQQLDERRSSLIGKAKHRVSLALSTTKNSLNSSSPRQREEQVYREYSVNTTPRTTPNAEEKLTPRSDCSSGGTSCNSHQLLDAESLECSSNHHSVDSSSSSESIRTPRFSFASIFPSCLSSANNTTNHQQSVESSKILSDFDRMKHERMLKVKYFEEQLEYRKVKSISSTRRNQFKNKVKLRLSTDSSCNEINNTTEAPSLLTTTISQHEHTSDFKSLIKLDHSKLRWNWNFYEISSTNKLKA